MDHSPPMPSLTGWFIIITVTSWFVWEIFAVINNRETLSHAIWRFSNTTSSMRFLMGLIIGLLLGHWFW